MVLAEHRTHHLPNTEQIRYVLCHRRGLTISKDFFPHAQGFSIVGVEGVAYVVEEFFNENDLEFIKELTSCFILPHFAFWIVPYKIL